jgi:hypothetical protein
MIPSYIQTVLRPIQGAAQGKTVAQVATECWPISKSAVRSRLNVAWCAGIVERMESGAVYTYRLPVPK